MCSWVSHQSSWADLPGTVAALAGQVLAVSQEARGPSALERQPGVDEGGGTAVMVHEERLHVYTTQTTNYPIKNPIKINKYNNICILCVCSFVKSPFIHIRISIYFCISVSLCK